MQARRSPTSLNLLLFSRATESFVVVPFELVKIKYVAIDRLNPRNHPFSHVLFLLIFRLQDKSSTFAGPIDVLKTIIRKEGVLGLYAGMESTFWRHFWWNGGYFGSIFQVKSLLPKPTVCLGECLSTLCDPCCEAYRIKLPKCETTCCLVRLEVWSVQF